MNGKEYDQLFKMAQEGRDAALSCVRVVEEHGHRIIALERSVNKNNEARVAARIGTRVLAWVGSAMVGASGAMVALWANLGGPNGPN